MADNNKTEWLMMCLIKVLGRIGVKTEEVCKIVCDRPKQIEAYNLCDGSQTLTYIAKKTNIAISNLSNTVDRWVNNGIAFRFKEGNEVRILHIFPITSNNSPMRKRRRKKRR